MDSRLIISAMSVSGLGNFHEKTEIESKPEFRIVIFRNHLNDREVKRSYLLSIIQVLESKAILYFRPNTFFNNSVVRATGFFRILASSSATLENKPSRASLVT